MSDTDIFKCCKLISSIHKRLETYIVKQNKLEQNRIFISFRT